MKNRDVIMFGLQPWDIEIGSNFKNIAHVMSEQNRVLYVNRPLDFITKLRQPRDKRTLNRLQTIKKGKEAIEKIQENLWVFTPPVVLDSINFLPPGKLYRFFNQRNNKKLAIEINKVFDKLEFKKDILMIDNDFFNGLYLKELLNPKIFLYYLRDYLRSQSYFKKHGFISEPEIIKKADAVATNSLYLKNYAQKINSQSYYVGQGCEVEEFMITDQQVPADLSPISSPRIGYCGMLTSKRLDISLLEHIAKSLPEFNIVLVGPEDEEFKNSVLHHLPNVFFLGAKEPHELPAYVHEFDVCINPQLLNEMTIGNYPRKIDEYLAAGKPVVATKTEAMMYFKDVVYLGETQMDYISQIELAYLESDNQEKKDARVEMAKNHTWPASVGKIYEILKGISDE